MMYDRLGTPIQLGDMVAYTGYEARGYPQIGRVERFTPKCVQIRFANQEFVRPEAMPMVGSKLVTVSASGRLIVLLYEMLPCNIREAFLDFDEELDNASSVC